MKKTILTCIGVVIMVSTSIAQSSNSRELDKQRGNKLLTMREAIIGYNLYPRTKYVAWKGSENIITYREGNNIVGENAKTGKKSIIMSLEDLNKALGANYRGWGRFTWFDQNAIMVEIPGKTVAIDVNSKKIKFSIAKVKKGDNFTLCKTNKLMAFTKGNNLYYVGSEGKTVEVTSEKNKNIVSGQSISRNEFGIDGGIFWSPDGEKLGFYRKDETDVKSFPLLDITTRTGSTKNIKYPMIGMGTEHVSFGVYNLNSKKTVFLNVTDFDDERYITNVAWSPKSDFIYAQILNRGQNEMHLNKYNAETGAFIKTILIEKNNKFVEPQNPIVFLKKDPSKFIYRTNNRDGYFNLYLVSKDGASVNRITKVDADVAMIGEDGSYVYYTSAEVSPIQNQLFRCSLKGGKAKRLTMAEGWHNITISADCSYFIDSYSSLNVPGVLNLASSKGKIINQMQKLKSPDIDYNYGEISLGSVKSADGKYDNYYRLIKPINFDPSKKYPLILYVYGGPHSQLVKDNYQAEMRHWEMLMAQKGYVVFVMDNRGTLNRGAAYENCIHRECGQKEMADQMEGIKMLMSKPWIDKDRIGVHGWSYGGFMTISLITNYPQVFKVGVAGGPVIDWKWYEVMYGERYMDTEKENPEGFKKVSLINKAKDLKGKLLICQGLIDNTVVCEHSLSFIRECIKNNIPVDYFIYPCAEHNVRGVDRIHLMQKVTDYFEDYLK